MQISSRISSWQSTIAIRLVHSRVWKGYESSRASLMSATFLKQSSLGCPWFITKTMKFNQGVQCLLGDGMALSSNWAICTQYKGIVLVLLSHTDILLKHCDGQFSQFFGQVYRCPYRTRNFFIARLTILFSWSQLSFTFRRDLLPSSVEVILSGHRWSFLLSYKDVTSWTSCSLPSGVYWSRVMSCFLGFWTSTM